MHKKPVENEQANVKSDMPSSDRRFGLERIYAKEQSFKARNMPAIFRQKWQPEITLEMQLRNEKINFAPVTGDEKVADNGAANDGNLVIDKEDSAQAPVAADNTIGVLAENVANPAKSAAATQISDYYEVVLHLNITAKQEGLTVLTMELQQAGIFALQGFNEEEKKHLLSAYCPNVLFPYARKVISDMTVEASLPPLLLTPIDFEAVYREQMLKKSAQEK